MDGEALLALAREPSAITAAVVSGTLFLFMAIRSPRNVFATLLATMIGFIALWNLAEWLHIREGPWERNGPRQLHILWMACATLLPALFVHFTVRITEHRSPRRWIVPAYGAAALLLLPALGGLFSSVLYDFFDSTSWDVLYLVLFSPLMIASLLRLAARCFAVGEERRGLFAFPLVAGVILFLLAFADLAGFGLVANLGGAVTSIILFASVFWYREDFDAIAALRHSMETYVPPAVMRECLGNPGRRRAGASNRTVSVLFSDIKGFTQLSVDKAPTDVRNALNEYFDAMVKIALHHDGTVDSFMGDGLMVLFGDGSAADHAQRSVRAAIEMQQAAARLRPEWKTRHGMPLAIRIGISTGDVVIGNVGGAERRSYTVLGSAVNLAQRLESAAMPGGIMISERTRELIEGQLASRDGGVVDLKGFPEPVHVFTVPVE